MINYGNCEFFKMQLDFIVVSALLAVRQIDKVGRDTVAVVVVVGDTDMIACEISGQ